MWQGMDGLRGPTCSGTGYYLKRKTLFGSPNHEDVFLNEPESNFGLSSKFLASLKGINEQEANGIGLLSYIVSEEARNLASCTFENGTKWGKEASTKSYCNIGYSYDSLLESTFTGYLLHSKGCTTIDMKDTMVQQMKWSLGLLHVGLSRLQPSHIWYVKDVYASKHVLRKPDIYIPPIICFLVIWNYSSVVPSERYSLVSQGMF
ncbi:hypothetical protein HYC85_012717 [Camellia sinensis]|uniref:Uncharacterized protein n=1 Tax=Camellia sinensis TaxID=4442 RepID=A0A7J7HFL0_CAMSI|nr:hypothetical protein HYC85_012717 [Camellia sinensis]